jgi:hypothetical protein
VAPLVSPILLLLCAAVFTDPEMASLRSEIEASRLTRMTRNARTLADGGHLRAGITAEHAGEIMWTYSSPELYELLVVTRRWPLQKYGTFIADAMIAALLPPQLRRLRPARTLGGRFRAPADRAGAKKSVQLDALSPSWCTQRDASPAARHGPGWARRRGRVGGRWGRGSDRAPQMTRVGALIWRSAASAFWARSTEDR